MDQSKTPFLDALNKYIDDGISPFDVPGHHMGNAEKNFKDYIGELTYIADVNAR
jgi:arginine/lysine/ornithine decarboxylase